MALTDNIVAYWKLDESSGNAGDSVGGFTLTNTNTVLYDPGIINNGADFGTNNPIDHNRLTIANNLGIDGTAITISAWIFNAGQGSTKTFIGCGSVTTRVLYYMKCSNVNFQVGRWRVPGTNTVTANVSISTDVWTHCVLTYDATTLAGYINNVPITGVAASGNGTSTLTSETSLGGYPQLSASEFINGNIDEVGIWSRALSSGEVNTLYNNGAGLQYPFTPPVPTTHPSFLLNFC